MGGNRDGENILGRIVEGATIGAVVGVINNGLREGYQPGFQNRPPGYPNENYGQNSLPRIEIDRMHEDSRLAAGDLLRSGGRDQELARAELQHAGLIDNQFHQHGRYYQEALRELTRDVREQSHGREDLQVGQYNGRIELRLINNQQPLYEQRGLPPSNFYSPQNQYVPRDQFKR